MEPTKQKDVTFDKKSLRMKGLVPNVLRTLFRTMGPIAPNLMASFAMKLFFTPRRIPRPGWELEIAGSADETFSVEALDRKVSAWAWGKGPAVLLVHGWEGRGTQLGYFVKPLLEQGFRVVCFDAPGHGDSAGSQTNAMEYKALIEAIAQREGGLYGVITHSFGAVPTSFALRHGLSMNKAVFISPPSEFTSVFTYFQKELCIPDVVVKRMVTAMERRFPTLGNRLWHELCTHVSARHLPMPGMVIHDLEDKVVPPSQGRLIADAWRGVEHMETSGLGHRRILKDQQVIERVVGFFKNNAMLEKSIFPAG